MGRRFGDRLARQERFRRGLLCVTFGVVLPILVMLAAGVGLLATFSGG